MEMIIISWWERLKGRKGVTKRRTQLRRFQEGKNIPRYKVLGETLTQGVVVDTAFETHLKNRHPSAGEKGLSGSLRCTGPRCPI